MKIHSDILTKQDIIEAATNADLGTSIYFTTLDARGSRSREHAFEFRLASNTSMRRSNSGTHGAGSDHAASWDDHGHFFARVFLADPEAKIGRYDGEFDFHVQTDGLYTIVRASA